MTSIIDVEIEQSTLILHGLNTQVICRPPFADSFADLNETLFQT